MDEKEFLVLIRDKVDRLITEIAVNGPLIEISAMITGRLKELEEPQPRVMMAKATSQRGRSGAAK